MKKLISCLLAIFFALSSCSKKDDNNKEEGCNYKYTGTGWDYPIKPGTDEWFALNSADEMFVAVQVPEEVLDTLSPEDAVRLCITFPLFGNFISSSTSIQHGFSVMVRWNNILSHLLSRDDVGGLLIEIYKDAGESGFKTLPYCNELWGLKFMYIDLLLSQKEIIQNMTPDERLELMKEARSKGSYRIAVNILVVEEYPEFMASPNREAIIELINTGMWIVSNGKLPYEEIQKIANNYINSKN